eukprot:IDg8351t1
MVIISFILPVPPCVAATQSHSAHVVRSVDAERSAARAELGSQHSRHCALCNPQLQPCCYSIAAQVDRACNEAITHSFSVRRYRASTTYLSTMKYTRFIAPALVLAMLVARVAAMPVETSALRTVSRAAQFRDVPQTYTTAYKFSPQCPDKVVLYNLQVDDVHNIGYVNLSDIKEDGVQCHGEDGATQMALVSEATVKQANFLERLGFPKAAAGLKKNEAALATVMNSKSNSSLLVGFDEGTRICGASTYSSSTFYFFIREPVEFKVTIRTGTQMQLTNVTCPRTPVRSLSRAMPTRFACLPTSPLAVASPSVCASRTLKASCFRRPHHLHRPLPL